MSRMSALPADPAWDAEESSFECWLAHHEDELKGAHEGEEPPFRQWAWERYLQELQS